MKAPCKKGHKKEMGNVGAQKGKEKKWGGAPLPYKPVWPKG